LFKLFLLDSLGAFRQAHPVSREIAEAKPFLTEVVAKDAQLQLIQQGIAAQGAQSTRTQRDKTVRSR